MRLAAKTIRLAKQARSDQPRQRSRSILLEAQLPEVQLNEWGEGDLEKRGRSQWNGPSLGRKRPIKGHEARKALPHTVYICVIRISSQGHSISFVNVNQVRDQIATCGAFLPYTNKSANG